MINYKDLMIGNWVYSSEKTKFPMRVVNIGEDYCYLDFEGNEGDVFECKDKDMMPIEVTDKLFLDNGFEASDYPNEEGNAIYEKEADNYCLFICKSKGKCFCEIENYKNSEVGNFYFQYLHELQNGIRLITKSDLEIKEL